MITLCWNIHQSIQLTFSSHPVNSNAKFGIFDDVELDRRLSKWLRQRPTARNCKIGAQNVYIAVSSCRSLSQSPGVSFFALGVVENSRFAVGIAVIFVILSEIYKYFRFGLPHCYFRLSVNVAFILDTFFEFGMVDIFVYRARITVILTSDLFGCMSQKLWLCCRWRQPITTSGFVRHLENIQIRLFTLLPSHLTIFSL